MNEANPKSEHKGFWVDLTPLKHSNAFARLWVGGAVSQIGAHMTAVAVGMHVFDITGSTFAVSMVAFWALAPMIIAGLWGGMIADAFDRRLVSLISASVSWASIIVLATVSFMGVLQTWPLYVLAAINAASTTIMWTTRSAILPRLLPPALLPAASALHGITFGIAVTVGPAVGGVLASTVGFSWTYTVDAVLFAAGFLGILTLPQIKPGEAVQKPGLASLREGWQFLRQSPNLRATFIYDIIAMTFGQPRALFPAVGMLVLGGGYTTAGLLTAGVAVGAFASSLFSGWLGRVRWQGRAVTLAIMGYGVSIILFALVLLVAIIDGGSKAAEPRYILIALALIALALSGATDNISAVFRTTILQVATPDSMRGRLQGISTVVVTGGPRVGDLFVGALATFMAAWAPPLIGGLAIAGAMFVLLRTARVFMKYDALDPQP